MAKIGNQGDGGGRPMTVLSESQMAELETLGAVLSIEQCADYMGIPRNTFFQILERQPEVSVLLKKGKSNAIRNIGGGLIAKAMRGDTASAMFYLKTQAGWKETQVQEVKDGTKISVNIKKPSDIDTDEE